MKKCICFAAAVFALAGCSAYRGPVWVMRVESSPTGARIFRGDQPKEYLGSAPCNAVVPAKAGGKFRGSVTIWAMPPTNSPSLYAQKISFTGVISRVQLPPALFFDLTQPPKQ